MGVMPDQGSLKPILQIVPIAVDPLLGCYPGPKFRAESFPAVRSFAVDLLKGATASQTLKIAILCPFLPFSALKPKVKFRPTVTRDSAHDGLQS